MLRGLGRLLWLLVSRGDDPQRVDWASVFCLVAYAALAIGFVGLIAYFMVSLAINGLDGFGGR
jgi:hypothetical protein